MSTEALIALSIVALAALASHGVARRWTRLFPAVGAKVTVDGVALHYVDRPADPSQPTPADGLPVLFLHGASGNLLDPYMAFGDQLRGRRLIFIDRPGHGHSERGGVASSSPIRQAALVKGVLERIGVDRVLVVGHSLGASVAAAFALRYPEMTAGLVFVSPASHPWGGHLPWYHRLTRIPVLSTVFVHALALPIGLALMPAMVKSTFAPQPAPERYMRRIGGYLVLRPSSFRANSRDVNDLDQHLAAMAPSYHNIHAPTVIVTGDSDPVVWAEIHAEGLHRDIAGSRLVVLPGVGHMPHHTATATVIAAIEEVAAKAGVAV